MIQKVLKEFGLSQSEVEVCEALIKLGHSKASHIASEVELPRQTTYSILKKLVQQNVITQSSLNGVNHFFCDYRHVEEYLESEIRRLTNVKKFLQGKSVAFLGHKKTPVAVPRVQYYEGEMGLKHLFDSILGVYKKGKSKKFRGYGVNHFSYTKGVEEYLRYFVQERSKLGVTTNLLIAKGPDDFGITTEGKRLGRNIRHLDINEQLAGIYLVADRVYFFSYKDNVGIMIENQTIVQFLKDAFDDHWTKA